MRKLHLILFIFILSNSFGQIIHYYDWSDANLKGEPEYVKEILFFSFYDLVSGVFKDNSCFSMAQINEYHFDSIGAMTQHYSKWVTDTAKINYSGLNRDYIHYIDSVVVLSKSHSGEILFQSVRHLDSDGCVIAEFYKNDSLRFQRNSDNKVVSLSSRHISVDTEFVSRVKNTYNLHGDIQSQKVDSEKHFLLSSDTTYYNSSTSEFEYIYDKKGNWIIRTELIDEDIVAITQRKIRY